MPPDRKRALEVQSLEAMEAMLEHHLEQAKKRLKEMDDDEAFDEQWDGTTNCKDMEGARKMVVDAEQLEVGGDYFGGGMDNKDTLEIQEMYGSEVYACDPGSCISTPRDWTKPESTALHKAVFIQCARTRELHNLFQEKHADPATEPLIFTPPPTITWSEAYRYIEDFTLADWQDVSTVYNSLKVDIYQIRGAIDCLLQWHHNESLLLPKGATYQEAIVCHATRQVPESKMSLERIRTECQLNKVEPTISQITHAAGRLQQNLLFEEDEMVKFLELLGVYGTGNPEFIAAKMQDAFPRMKGVGLAEFKGIIGEFANWDGSVVSDKQPETLKEAVCNMEIVRRSRLKPPVKWALDLAGVGWLSQMRPEVAKHFEASHTTRSLKRIELLASAGTTGALTRDHVAVLKASHITPFRRVTRCGVSRPTLKPPVSGLPVIHASQYSQKAFSSMMEALCGHAPGQTATFTKAYNEAARRDYEMIEQDPEQNKLLEATNAHPSTMVFVSALTAAFEGVLLNGLGGTMGGFENPLRKEVLQHYKKLLQLSEAMPTRNRREWMRDKVMTEFRRDKDTLEDMEEIQYRVSLAKVQAENSEAIGKHLTRWLGRDDQGEDPLELGPSEPNLDMLEYDYNWEREWDNWRITHPRHCQPHEAGTLQAIEQWKRMVKNKRARKELIPPPPKFKFVPS